MTALVHRGLPGSRPVADPLIEEARARQRRRRLRLAVLAFVLVTGAVGYGIGRSAPDVSSTVHCVATRCASTPAAAASVPNPCALLTNREAAGAVGSGILMRNPQSPPGMPPAARFRMCTWTGMPRSTYQSTGNRLDVMVVRTTKARFQKTAQAMRHAVRVKGLGEAAYATIGAATFLNVYARGLAFTFRVDAVAPLPVEKRIAKLVLARAR
jgi:hypothetical protein